jgi:menaquinone-dependent protoporphyrinogen IX oxidase
MKKIAFIYFSKHEFTKKIVLTLQEKLLSLNNEVDVFEVGDNFNLNSYEVVVFSSPVYYGKLNKNIIDLIESTVKESKIKIFLFATGFNSSEFNLINNFNKDIDKKIEFVGYFGGRVDFSSMNFMEKFIIKNLMKTKKTLERINQQKIDDFVSKIQND